MMVEASIGAVIADGSGRHEFGVMIWTPPCDISQMPIFEIDELDWRMLVRMELVRVRRSQNPRQQVAEMPYRIFYEHFEFVRNRGMYMIDRRTRT